MPDMVNHPPHYTAGNIEAIDAIRAALGPEGFVAYCRGTAIKYNWRAGLKGDAAQDLEKGAWYDRKGAEVASGPEFDPGPPVDLHAAEVERLKGVIAARDAEIQGWAEAQEAVRAQWVQIVEALGAIVPVIEGETTMSMVKRIQSLVASLKILAEVPPNVRQEKAKLAMCLQGLRDIAEGDSGSLAIGQWMALHAKETIEKVEA